MASEILTPIETEVWSFTPNLASIALEARKLYDILRIQTPKLSIEMFEYYVTALLWARLLDIKYKNGFEELSQEEVAYRAYFSRHLYVPRHIYEMFGTIGNVLGDGRRTKTMYLADHSLPVCVAGGKGGYHAERIDKDSHNLFEEVPSLGVIGDSLMASAIEVTRGWRQPNFPFLPSDRTKAAPKRLIGYYGPVLGTDDVYRFLSNIAISPQYFDETIPNTRFNVNIMQYVSSILSEAPDMRQISILEMDCVGTPLQLVQLFPTWMMQNFSPDIARAIARSVSWMEAPAHPEYIERYDDRALNSVDLLRFRLYKEVMLNSHAHWCCVEARGTNSWQIPNDWIQNRNARRAYYSFRRTVYAYTNVFWDTAQHSPERSFVDERRQRRRRNTSTSGDDIPWQYHVPIIVVD